VLKSSAGFQVKALRCRGL